MRNELITVFGGSGFIGRYVVRELCRRGYRVRVAVRRPHLVVDIKVAGEIGQIQIVQANIRNRASVERAAEGADGIVNLVGIGREQGRQRFMALMGRGAGTVAAAAAAAGAHSLIHVSASVADARSPSAYARAKAAGEGEARAAFPAATILRPTLVFGPEDRFFNKFAQLARFTPVLPLPGGGRTRMQPVFAGDVARAVAGALERPQARGRDYVLAGPGVFSFRELMEAMLRQTARRRILAPLPWWGAAALGKASDLAALFPFISAPVTADQVALLRRDDVAPEGEDGLAALGVERKESLDALLPAYLARFRKPSAADRDALALAGQA